MSYNTESIDINLTQADFKKIKDYNPKNFEMIINAYNAITLVEGWDFLREFNEESFMLSSNPMIVKITNAMTKLGYSGHTGYSFGCTLRNMQYLAKHGKTIYINAFNSKK